MGVIKFGICKRIPNMDLTSQVWIINGCAPHDRINTIKSEKLIY